MTTTAFYIRRLAGLVGSPLARRGRVVVAWLLVLATVSRRLPLPCLSTSSLYQARGSHEALIRAA